MSTTIRPHTMPVQLIFPPPFLAKDRTYRLCCLNAAMAAQIPSSPLTYLIFLSISFTSPNSLPSTTELIFLLLSLSSLSIIPDIFPSFFHCRPTNLLHFSIFPRFSPISSSPGCPSSWSGRSFSLRALLLRLCLVGLPVKLLLYSPPCW